MTDFNPTVPRAGRTVITINHRSGNSTERVSGGGCAPAGGCGPKPARVDVSKLDMQSAALAAQGLTGPVGPRAGGTKSESVPVPEGRIVNAELIPEGIKVLGSEDGSVLFKGQKIDTVRFPPREGVGPSVCVSVQSGCSLQAPEKGCRFCSTGWAVQFEGNLTTQQIVDQAKMALLTDPSFASSPRARVVFAGMGESSYNRKNVVAAMIQLQHELRDNSIDFVIASIGTPPHHLKQMGEFIEEAFDTGQLKKGTQIFLQISMHAPTDEKRRHVIPVAADFTVAQVLENAVAFRDRLKRFVDPELQLDDDYPKRSVVTLNYLMLGSQRTVDGLEFEGNYTDADRKALVSAIDKLGRENFLIRLSAYNPDLRDAHSFGTVGEEHFERWSKALSDDGVLVRRFKSQASDVRGGCGQLTAADEPLAPGEAPKPSASAIARRTAAAQA